MLSPWQISQSIAGEQLFSCGSYELCQHIGLVDIRIIEKRVEKRWVKHTSSPTMLHLPMHLK